MKQIPWNYDWFYKPSFVPADAACTDAIEGFAAVELPHTNRLLPYNYFEETACQFVSCYKKLFAADAAWAGKTVMLRFEGVMLSCRVYCNGVPVGSHAGGFTPFLVDLTDQLKLNDLNVLVVEVDSTEQSDIPPFGNVVDYLTFGGIYREVELCLADPVRIDRLWITSVHTLEQEKDLQVRCEITAAEEGSGVITVSLMHPDGHIARQETSQIHYIPGTAKYLVELKGLTGIRLWDTEHPVLYGVQAELISGGSREICRERFGFRTVRFAPDGFYLNEKKTKLIGLNRHQGWPYVGYAMPRRVQRKDAEILRRELHCNMVRTSHYPQSRHFLDACDELGLLVMEELPGWQHIGDSVWKERALQDVRDMIIRDVNRPSVILWGVRINESPDDHDFYQRTNALAHQLDPSRPTGGTRHILGSEFLEDVYTYNDFTLDGEERVFRPQKETTGLDRAIPMLVTESNGHMYPTKRFDQEERLSEHALRHLRVMQEALQREDLAGGISWCAFDYHTHGCFGSGDKICYHGVCDMYRNPKWAAWAYRSQKDPAEEVVLQPITVGSRGERDRGGMVPFYVLTNCDFVRVYKNGRLVGDFTPQRAEFPALAHPPVQIWHLMEAEMDLGFAPADREEFFALLEHAMQHKGLTALCAEDAAALSALAARYDRTPAQLMDVMMQSAAGWGERENALHLEGWWNGKVAAGCDLGDNKWFDRLEAVPDDVVLYSTGDTYDATRIVIRALDQLGGLTPYLTECVEVEVTGPVQVIGPTRFPLQGGTGAFWVRTTGEVGRVQITVQGMRGTACCTLEVR